MHGYQLYEFIDRDMGSCIAMKKPTAYYLLNKMAQDGWLSEEQTQEGNRPPRTVYHMTAHGELAFQKLLRENLASFTPASFPGDIGLAFLDELQPQEALTLLQQRRTTAILALDTAQAAPQHHGSLQYMLTHQVQHLQAELDWIDRLIGQLQTQGNTIT
jgi:DNA-binding PadR family transcriptional regulator